ncbi:MAG: hypothetical protein Q7T54_00140 [Candidatus Levybacteria bacterium]|nr:hypothetical protein [Candidatus Levybacteria bacterium]
MQERRIGYILLGVGIFVMIAAVITVVLSFTGKVTPYKLFNIPAPSFNTANLIPGIPGLPKAQGEKIEVLPTEAFSNILNLGVQFMLMTFVMSFGFKLADLGVKLLRPIKIEAKT